MPKVGKRIVAVGLLLSASSMVAYAACSDEIRRVVDGKHFDLVQTVTHNEGGRRIGFKDWGITLDGGELVQYGQYKADDGTTVLVKCSSIGAA